MLVVCFFIYEIYSKLRSKYKYFSLGFLQILIPFLAIFAYANYSAYLLRGIDFRQELIEQAWQIFQKSPYFGIGLNNFFVWQEPLIKTISPINFQPPHNIFLVALLSVGLFGWWIVPVGFFWTIRALSKKIQESRITNHELREFYRSILICLIGIIVVGMFDHFFLTLEQGQVMLTIILGLSFSNVLGEKGKVKREK